MKLKILLEAAEKISAPFKRAGKSTDDLKKALKAATDNIRGLERQSGQIEAFGRLKTDARANATALNEARQKAKAMAVALKDAGGGTKKARAEFARARTEVNRLKAAEQSIARETETMRRKMHGAGIDTRNLSAAQRRLKSDMDAARAAATREAQGLDALRKKTTALAKARNRLTASQELQGRLAMGGAVGMGTGAAALGIGSRMAMDGISFGEQMSAVGGIARLDKTSAEFAKLKAMAEDLGASTSFSASEVAQGMQFLAMAGFDAQKMLAAMPGMLDLAKAGATDLATTTDIASNILSGFGLQASEMGRLGDVMVATFTRSNVDLSMLGSTMKYTAPIARQFGASIEDVSAMTGLLGNVGIQGEMAGTSLRALFTRMASPPMEAQKALNRLGIETRDAAGNMRPMTEILAEVAKKTEKMGSGRRIGMFTDIAGMNAGSAMAELVGQGGSGAITKFVDILKEANGEAGRLAAEMGDNEAGDIKSFGSAVEGMNIALTQTNSAPLRELIQSATEVVRGITAWVKENPKLAGTLVKVAAGLSALVFVGGALSMAIASVLGPFALAKFAMTALSLQGGILSGVLGTLGTVGSGALGLLTTGIKAVGLAFMTNPIGLAITAIIAGLTILYNAWEPFRELVDSVFGRIADIFGFGDKESPLPDMEQKAKAIAPTRSAIKTAPMKIASTAMATTVAATAAVAPVAAAPTGGGVNMGGVTIVVNAAPGQSEDAIAMAVRRELEKMEARQRARARSGLYDGNK